MAHAQKAAERRADLVADRGDETRLEEAFFLRTRTRLFAPRRVPPFVRHVAGDGLDDKAADHRIAGHDIVPEEYPAAAIPDEFHVIAMRDRAGFEHDAEFVACAAFRLRRAGKFPERLVGRTDHAIQAAAERDIAERIMDGCEQVAARMRPRIGARSRLLERGGDTILQFPGLAHGTSVSWRGLSKGLRLLLNEPSPGLVRLLAVEEKLAEADQHSA